jgi:hypothetical protein
MWIILLLNTIIKRWARCWPSGSLGWLKWITLGKATTNIVWVLDYKKVPYKPFNYTEKKLEN